MLAALVVGCGRIGFDPLGSPDGPTGSFVISTTQLDVFSSWCDLVVDWQRSVAYVATRKPGDCFDVIDLAVSPPAVVQRRGPPATTGDTCIGVGVTSSGDRLLVTTYAGAAVELWDLGVDPRAGNYLRLAVTGVVNPRRLAFDHADPARVYVSLGRAPAGIQPFTILPTTPYLAAGPAFHSTQACPDQADATVDLEGVAVSACSTNDSSLEIVDDQTMSLVGTLPAAPSSGESGFGSAARVADGSVAAIFGWVSVVLATPTPGSYQLLARFHNDAGYRGVQLVDRGTGLEAWTARNDGVVDVISLAQPSDPVVVGESTLSVAHEPYGIAVDPTSSRGIVVTNGGELVVIDLAQIAPTNFRWPAF